MKIKMKCLSKLVFIITVVCISLVYTVNAWCVTEEQWAEWVNKLEKIEAHCSPRVTPEGLDFIQRVINSELTEEGLFAILDEKDSLKYVLNGSTLRILANTKIPAEVLNKLRELAKKLNLELGSYNLVLTTSAPVYPLSPINATPPSLPFQILSPSGQAVLYPPIDEFSIK